MCKLIKKKKKNKQEIFKIAVRYGLIEKKLQRQKF